MHRKKPLSDTQEMYLKTLYTVQGDQSVARVRDLADGLGVSPGTVSGVLKKLDRLDLIEHERYGAVALTEAGEQVAQCVVRRFETLRDVLVEIFGLDPETAATDACMMEHAVSPTTVNRMRRLLELRRLGIFRPPTLKTADELCSQCASRGVCHADA